MILGKRINHWGDDPVPSIVALNSDSIVSSPAVMVLGNIAVSGSEVVVLWCLASLRVEGGGRRESSDQSMHGITVSRLKFGCFE